MSSVQKKHAVAHKKIVKAKGGGPPRGFPGPGGSGSAAGKPVHKAGGPIKPVGFGKLGGSGAAPKPRKGRPPGAKKPVARKKRGLALPGSGDIHELPVCAAAAVAAHLYFSTEFCWTPEEILALAAAADTSESGALIESVLEVAAAGFRGAPAAVFSLHDPVPGTIAGLTLPCGGSHAAMLLDGAMTSWGGIIPAAGVAEEAWAVRWDT